MKIQGDLCLVKVLEYRGISHTYSKDRQSYVFFSTHHACTYYLVDLQKVLYMLPAVCLHALFSSLYSGSIHSMRRKTTSLTVLAEICEWSFRFPQKDYP